MNRRRTVLSILPLLAVAAVIHWTGCGRAEEPKTPERLVSKRIRILEPERYRELRDAWKEYTERRPDDPMGWVELGKAMRYSGSPPEEFFAAFEKAIAVDPDYAEAHGMYGASIWPYKSQDPDEVRKAIRELNRALALDPENIDPYYMLWSCKLTLGDRAGAAESLRSLLRGGGLPEPLLDLAHNMLVDADSNSIVFTNGDNDTYPPLALQATHGFRTDVAIVNLSLLNTEWYREMLRGAPYHLPVPEPEKERGVPPGPKAALGLLNALERDGWKRTAYVATTVYAENLPLTNKLSLEGVLYRVLPEKKEEWEMDMARIERNLRKNYRLESAAAYGFDWDKWSALRPLMGNYAALYGNLAEATYKSGDREGAREAVIEGLELCAFHGRNELGRKIAEDWAGWDTESAEARRWIERFTP
ncbi:MAG: hypothetical protein JW958_09710 [Candidatus Eisenbacteria bacterium]|nr:hypothetical protein [Candidatus Eisenbacteria bacterium]